MAGIFCSIFTHCHIKVKPSMSSFLRIASLPQKSLSLLSTTMAFSNGVSSEEPSPKVANISPFLRIKKHSPNAILPSRGTPLSAGYDLSSAVEAVVPAREIALIATDLSISVPQGTYARIAPRSSLALKHSIHVLDTRETYPNYRGPIRIMLFNHSDKDFNIKPGDRIAQIIIELNMIHDEATKLSSFLKFKKLSNNAILPSVSSLSPGYDLFSAVQAVVPARGKVLIATDLSISIPELTYARIAPKSNLASKHSINIGAGIIDADYRGPIGVVLFNHSGTDFNVKVGDHIAHMMIKPIMTPDVMEVDNLEETIVEKLGYDLNSVVEAVVPARGNALIATDFNLSIPEGSCANIAPRSILALKHSIDVSSGVINSEYRGVVIFNHSDTDFTVKLGDCIARMIIGPIMAPDATEVQDLDETERGQGGFGSTGV